MEKITRSDSIKNYKALVNIIEERYKWEDFSNREKREMNPEEVPTIVFLIGAGLSVWSMKKMWKDIKDELYETILKSYGNNEIIISEIWSVYNNKLGIKHPNWTFNELKTKLKESLDKGEIDIEDIASVACRFQKSDEIIRNFLTKKYDSDNKINGGHPPQLGYELLAHFLKHSFCDHILTFNFDEILDVALENELGVNNYEKIISEHDVFCHSKNNKKYIKLHGSVSSPQSLKFSAEDTGKLSNRMIKILDESIFYITKNKKLNSKVPELNKNITIISLGYSWDDEDIANWIKSRQNHIKSLFVLTGRSEEIPRNLIGINQIRLNLICNSHFDKQLFIDQFLWMLWNNIEKKISNLPYVPASRHLILGHLFGINVPNYRNMLNAKNDDIRFLNAHLIDRRLRMEVFLHLIKCRGMINMSVMASIPKIDKYFKLFKKYRKIDKNILDSYESFLQKDIETEMRETYFSKGENIIENIKLFGKESQFNMNRVYIPNFNEETDSFSFDMVARELFWCNELEKIFKGPEIEIMPGLDPRASWAFKSPITLNNFYELQSCTKELLKENWTHLIMVAETGEWLFTNEKFNCSFKNGKKEIFLIKTSPPINSQIWAERKIIDESVQKSIKEKQPIKCHEARIRWWEHERHLTLALNIKNNKATFLGGIYFLRRLKTTQISPVFLQDVDDCYELFKIFKLYSDKAIKGGTISVSSNYIDSITNLENILAHEYDVIT